MTTNAVSSPNAPGPVAAPPPVQKKRRWLLWGCGGVLALLLIIVATVAITLWWIQRPIKPVVLTAPEKAAVEAKLEQLKGGAGRTYGAPSGRVAPAPSVAVPAPAPNREAVAPRLTPEEPAAPGGGPGTERPYTPGSKVLTLTEREINGLLNQNTEFGDRLRLEFARDAINAYMAVPIPQDFPVGGGRTFRARGRLRVSIGNGGAPYVVVEDVTVMGLSLPKAWLGGLKGENLLGAVMGQPNGAGGFPGIKSLRIEPGALVIQVED